MDYHLRPALRAAGLTDTAQVLCGTIHRFQGSERDVMVISPVGAAGINDRTRGWLIGETNLWNVAITRARSQLVVVGDRSWWSGQRGLLAALAVGDVPPREASRTTTQRAADRLHAALRASGLKIRRDAAVAGRTFELLVAGPAATTAVLVDNPAGDPSGRGLRKVLSVVDIGAGDAEVVRAPLWRCLAAPDEVAAELVAICRNGHPTAVPGRGFAA